MQDQPSGAFRLGQVDRVSSPWHERRDGAGSEPSQADGMRRITGVIHSGHGEHGWLQGRHAVPNRLLRPSTAQAQTRSQTSSRIPASLLLPRLGGGQAGEHRPAEPLLDELCDVVRGLETVSQFSVRSSPPLAGLVVLNACRSPDDDHPADLQSTADGEMQGDTGAQRVTEDVRRLTAVDLSADGVRDESGGARNIGANGIGSSVARQVHADEPAMLLQSLAETTPEPAGLGEPVEHHQRRPRPARLDVKWHGA